MRTCLTERFVSEVSFNTLPVSGLGFSGEYCYCGNFLRDVASLPRGHVHFAAAWQLVSVRLCPTFEGVVGGGVCRCRRKCVAERLLDVIRSPTDDVSLRDLARLLRLFRQRLPLDLLAARASAVSRMAIRKGNRQDMLIRAEFADFDKAEKRLRAIN